MKRRKDANDSLKTDEDTGPPFKKSKEENDSPENSVESVEDLNGRPSRRRTGRLGSVVSPSEDGSAHSDDRESDMEVSKQDGQADDQQEIGNDVLGEITELNITPRRGRPKASLSDSMSQVNGNTPGKKLFGKGLFSTPVKASGATESKDTPRLERNADRSARRKYTRALIERTVLGNTSDNDDEVEEIVQHIYDSGEEEDPDGQILEEGMIRVPKAPETPLKRKGKQKGPKPRQRSPTPLLSDLSAHEKYFFQNRGGKIKTSDNNLSSMALLDHEEYFNLVRGFRDPHTKDVEALQELHSRSFSQWQFEMSQDFNLCLYGWGSKRSLLMRFADHIYKSQPTELPSKIVVVNGYVHNLNIRDVLNTLANAISGPGQKLGSQAAEMMENVIALLQENIAQSIILIIHSIDRMPLRRPAAQAILSRLAALPQIHLVASADHPSFPLLWDSSLRSTYNFLFHDCTTFEPYTVEIDVVDEVHELLGRSGRRIGGKEGVSFVLRSLPENAKNLFRVLIGEQLATMDGSYGNSVGELGDEEDDDENRTGTQNRTEIGVEYRVLYQKAVEEFICSNEMNFRTLLKEFHDHQMIESRKDTLGTEMLSVPFRKEELETILEDMMS